MNKTDKITTRTAVIFLDENNILHINIIDGIKMDYEDALDNHLVCKHLSKNQKVLKLLDSRVKWEMDKKARDFAESKEIEENTIARAVIQNSTFQNIISNFFLSLNKPNVPTKIFLDRDEAYNWLLKFKKI